MSRSLNKNEFANRIATLTNNEYVPLSDYESSSKKILIYHKKCKNTYEVTPNNFLKGRRCPYCAGKIVISDKNSLFAKGSFLLHEWDYEKNIIKPNEISAFSSKRVYWKCEKGHSWLATPNSRMHGIGCPTCHKDKLLKYSAGNNKIIKEILDNKQIDYIFDYRIKECKIKRPVPYSVAVFVEDKLLGLIDYRSKYYSEEVYKTKEKYCKEKNIPYLFLELDINNQFSVKQITKINEWLNRIQ